MASGVPIVASRLPSIQELLNDENAFLVPPDDPEALARGIQEALAHPDEARRKALLARACVSEHTWEKRAERITQAIRSRVLSG